MSRMMRPPPAVPEPRRRDPNAPAPAANGRRSRRFPVLLLGSAAAGAAVSLVGLRIFAGRVSPTRAGAPAGGLDQDTVAVDRPAIDLGRVALNVGIPVSVRLVNQSLRTVTLGKPTADALEGCWPPSPVVGATTLLPGESTVVRFTTGMHAGMDGPHVFLITVPTSHPKTPKVEYTVTANFG